MALFDFSTQVSNGSPYPLLTNEFSFRVIGASASMVDQRGIHCGNFAVFQTTVAVDGIEFIVTNGAGGTTITATDAAGSHTQTEPVTNAPGPQTVRFNFGGIRLITFEAPGNELYLKSAS